MHQTFVSLLVVCAVQRAEVRAIQHVIRLCSFKQSRECFYLFTYGVQAILIFRFLTIQWFLVMLLTENELISSPTEADA